jgi:hypothetical protein
VKGGRSHFWLDWGVGGALLLTMLDFAPYGGFSLDKVVTK